MLLDKRGDALVKFGDLSLRLVKVGQKVAYEAIESQKQAPIVGQTYLILVGSQDL